MALASRISASCSPSHSDAVEGGGGGGDVAGHDRGAGQAGAELRLAGGRCAVEGVAVGPDGGRIADGQQEVGPQGEETAAVLGSDVGSDRLDHLEGVPVGADRSRRLRGLQVVGRRPPGLAGFEEVVADARR